MDFTFFLAHAGADTARAKALCDALQPDVSVFLDAVNLKPGDNWDSVLPEYQRKSLATVALISASTESAYYLREEIATAIALQRHDPDGHRLIAVYLDGKPADPVKIPYGLRIAHALDAVALGSTGLVAELKRLALTLDGESPEIAAAPVAPPPADRFALYNALCRLLPAQFDEVQFRVSAPKQHLPPTSEPLSRRALDLVQWSESLDDLSKLSAVVRQVAPGVLH